VAQIRRDYSLYRTANFCARVEPMHEALVQQVRPAILALMGAVIFLLLIACANVANLLRVRASARERELVVRSALGAGGWRLIRQMLVEAVLLTIPGTALGVALAWLGLRELIVAAPADLPRLDAVRIDPLVLGFAALAGMAAAFLFSLAPAWAALRLDLMSVLRFPFPLTGNFSTIRWGTGEALADNSKYQPTDWQQVLPGYFETMRTPLLEGRTFTEADNNPGRNVVIIDQFLAAKAFPHESAVGKRILIRVRTPEPEWVEVIGVVAHQRTISLAEPGREQVYFTDGFSPFGGDSHWAIRTSGDPAQYAAAVRAEILRFDPGVLVTEILPMDRLVRRAQAGTRF
jgi:hypothetical protein